LSRAGTVVGVAATRFSPGSNSRGIPMIMMVTLRPNVLTHDTGVARFPRLGAMWSEKWRTPLAVTHRIFEGNQLLG